VEIISNTVQHQPKAKLLKTYTKLQKIHVSSFDTSRKLMYITDPASCKKSSPSMEITFWFSKEAF